MARTRPRHVVDLVAFVGDTAAALGVDPEVVRGIALRVADLCMVDVQVDDPDAAPDPRAAGIGSPLTAGKVRRVYQTVGQRRRFVGSFDEAQHLYQFRGHDLSTMVYWQVRAVVLGVDEWSEIETDVARLELIDLPHRRLYVCPGGRAREHGGYISTPAGARYAIPLDCWDAYDDAGEIVTRASKF